MQLPPKHCMATTNVRSSEVQTVTVLCTRSARSRRPTQLPLRTRGARSRRPTQLPTTSAAFTGCRSKQRGLAQPKMFLYILARGATNYSTTYATKSTTQRVRTNKHTTDKDVTTCNAHRSEKTTRNQKAVALYDLTCTYRGARCTHATRQNQTAKPYATVSTIRAVRAWYKRACTSMLVTSMQLSILTSVDITETESMTTGFCT